MIPKTIHYCWFGRGPLPELAQKCIESWHKFMPDYEYKLWNEDNFDVNSIPYTKEAYEARKFAFVSDYVRLKALYEEGGLYMDTDVEVYKSFDNLMNLTAFAGYEGTKHHPVGTGIIASEKGGVWVREQLDYYSDELHFIKSDGSFDMTTNVVTVSKRMKLNGFIANEKYQVYKDLHVFPTDFFCPYQTTGELLITENTYCNHHFSGSWNDSRKKSWYGFIGQKNITRLIKLKRKLFG